MIVRERLSELLAFAGMSQAELARRMGESPAWVNHRLTGRTEIQADEVPRFARVLRVLPATFFETGNPYETDADKTPFSPEYIVERGAQALEEALDDREREFNSLLADLQRRYHEDVKRGREPDRTEANQND